MLNTFFFGYLSLKWKRLFRTLIIVTYLFWVWFSLMLAEYSIFNDNDYTYHYYIGDLIILISIPIVSIALISWVIKPFLVEEK